MADQSKDETKGRPASAPGDPQPSLAESAGTSQPGDKELQEANAAAAEAGQAQARALQAQEKAVRARREGAEKAVEEAKKNALDKDGNPKTNDQGQVLGLDGENPVSATNPDPRAVRGTYTL